VAGDVYAVDETTLLVKNFVYDGNGKDTFFWAGSSNRYGNRRRIFLMSLNPDRVGVVNFLNFLNFLSDSALSISGPISDSGFFICICKKTLSVPLGCSSCQSLYFARTVWYP
jgi:hypothetical protein